MSVQNAETANELADQLDQQAADEAADLATLDETRDSLEGGPEPNDDAPDTATDGGTEVATTDSTETEPVETAGYTMSVDRRIGSTHMTVTHYDGDGDEHESRLGFGKPNGRTSRDMFAPIDDAEEDEEQSIHEMTEYIWGTLSEWCLTDSVEGTDTAPTDPDFWAGRLGLGDAISVLRDLALGGAGPEP